MDIEYEATFPNTDHDQTRQKLQALGAVLVESRYQRRMVIFNLPEGHGIKGGWIRVRDAAGKITLSLKVVDGENTITRQKEIELKIDNFDAAVELMEHVGCERKAYQEGFREIWQLGEVEVTLDEWPFLEPFIEVEGKSEEVVRQASEKLGLDYSYALFDSVDAQYSKKYNITIDAVNQRTPKIVFDMENPFVNRND